MAVILLAGLQHGTCPLRMVGAVGILLALQTYTNVLRILDAVLADDVSILANTLEVARVNLYARLVGAHFHQDAGLGAP